MIPSALVKLVVPKIIGLITKDFKLDKMEKVLAYVEEDNELDKKVSAMDAKIKKLEKKCQNLEKNQKKG